LKTNVISPARDACLSCLENLLGHRWNSEEAASGFFRGGAQQG